MALIVGGGLLVLALLAMIALYVYASGKNHAKLRFADEDVTVTSCRRDPATGRPTAQVRVTSRASRTGSYRGTLAFTDKSGMGAGHATLLFNDVARGQSLTQQADGPADPASDASAKSVRPPHRTRDRSRH